MVEKTVSLLSILLNVIAFFTVGILFIFLPQLTENILSSIFVLTFFSLGILLLLTSLLKKQMKHFFLGLSTLFLSFLIDLYPAFFLSFFPFIFGIYLFINALVQAIQFLILKANKEKGKWEALFLVFLHLLFGLIFFLNPKKHLDFFLFVMGIYLLLLGGNNVLALFKELFPNYFDSTKRHFTISPPVIVLALLPFNIVNKINKYLQEPVTKVNISKNQEKTIDLEICVHVALHGSNRFGHVDICFENTVYSYGAYDEEKRKLFDGIGDGVLFEIKNKEAYYQFCREHSEKYLFIYGLTLTEEQKKKVKKRIQLLKSYTYRWRCNEEVEKDKHFDDYASLLYRYTNAKFYKFKKSTFKTFFVLTTNCVKLADFIVGASGLDILKMNGIITPGTYYHFLDSEFKRKRSNVISKKIIRRKEKKIDDNHSKNDKRTSK